MGLKRYACKAQWTRIAPLLPGKVGDPGRSGAGNRLFVNGFYGFCGPEPIGGACRNAIAVMTYAFFGRIG